jgi:hypothetical protein
MVTAHCHPIRQTSLDPAALSSASADLLASPGVIDADREIF